MTFKPDPDAADRLNVRTGTSWGPYSAAEHRILFEFWDDSGAVTFDHWWCTQGRAAFRAHCQAKTGDDS
jgi:hypothetical protein